MMASRNTPKTEGPGSTRSAGCVGVCSPVFAPPEGLARSNGFRLHVAALRWTGKIELGSGLVREEGYLRTSKEDTGEYTPCHPAQAAFRVDGDGSQTRFQPLTPDPSPRDGARGENK